MSGFVKSDTGESCQDGSDDDVDYIMEEKTQHKIPGEDGKK